MVPMKSPRQKLEWQLKSDYAFAWHIRIIKNFKLSAYSSFELPLHRPQRFSRRPLVAKRSSIGPDYDCQGYSQDFTTGVLEIHA